MRDKQTQALDYGEPWKPAFTNCFSINTGEIRYFECGWRDRAIACINACAGMADPAKEIAEITAYANKCREGCISLSHSIDRIDYLCGEPNEVGVSDYCIHQNDAAVVERVKKLRQERDDMREAIREAHRVLRDILKNYECGEVIDSQCETAIAKLQPFITT